MKTKKAIKYFSIMQYKSEEDYLRSMHQSGWKLVKVSGFCVYHFEECEPADMIYRLDYNQEGIRHKEEYIILRKNQFCGFCKSVKLGQLSRSHNRRGCSGHQRV